MRDPLHPWRVELRKTVEKLIAELATDPQMRARAEDLKAELLASPLLIEQAKTLWAEVETGLFPACRHIRRPLASVRTGAAQCRNVAARDEERKAQLNRRIRIIGERFLLPYRVEIGAYIERVVRNWDSATLVDRLELQVGKDLQYIRINGTLVGGLVGLLIFASRNGSRSFRADYFKSRCEAGSFQRQFHYVRKCAGVRIMKLKTAAADVEISAEERKLARIHTLADIGKCHQVTQRRDDRSALEPPEIIRVAALACSTDPVSRGRNQRHPIVDEIAFVRPVAVLDKSADAATVRVTHDDDVPDFKIWIANSNAAETPCVSPVGL